jgi:putative nucleotidyltransferase with HDIG domain
MAIYDRGTALHSARVAQASRAMAERLGMPERDVEAVSWAATLHDLGKLGVEVDVLRKKGPLDEDDWVQIHRHPIIGSDLVLAVSPELAPIAQAIRAHHERWDGAGYPDRLAGDDIPLLGRIVAITDSYDSMTHYRPYRARRLSPTHVLEEIQKEAGRQFDPGLVPVFISLHAEGLIASEGTFTAQT